MFFALPALDLGLGHAYSTDTTSKVRFFDPGEGIHRDPVEGLLQPVS